MIRTLTVLAFITFTFSFLAQNSYTFVLKGQIFNTKGNTLRFIQNVGDKNDSIIANIVMDKEGFFEQKIEVPERDYYILSLEDGQSINIIVEGSDTIKVYGDGNSFFFNSNIVNSDASKNLLDFLRVKTQYEYKLDSAQKYLEANKSRTDEIKNSFNQTHQMFLTERQYFLNTNEGSPAIIGVIPTLNMEQEFQIYEKIVMDLNKSFGDSPSVKRLVAEYEANMKQMQSANPFAFGNPAKEIALPNPEGDTLRLSDYKGKVVLIDFWASWCGPCRRENPNVVKAYNEFHEKGFDIFSVSLDKSKENWIQAIAQDGLVWNGHVSDLKFWQSVAARDYQVGSIPFTVLIDQEGKILGTNLRGEKLTQALRSILGD